MSIKTAGGPNQLDDRGDDMTQELVPVDIAARINDAHELAIEHGEQAIDYARQAGELLLQAKAAIGHGSWIPWLESNCTVGQRQAQRYMRLAKNWDAIRANPTSRTDLLERGISGALEDIADPKSKKSDVDRDNRLSELFWNASARVQAAFWEDCVLPYVRRRCRRGEIPADELRECQQVLIGLKRAADAGVPVMRQA